MSPLQSLVLPLYLSVLPYAPIPFQLPFDRSTEVVCTHSSGVGSHSYPNAFYALDLDSDYGQPPAIVRAAAAGKAFGFGDEKGGLCPELPGPEDQKPSSPCGMGWGNRVKILHAGGYYSFYVHLKTFFVTNGQQVKAGEAIGIEGSTGLAGQRQLHWSVQKLPGHSPAEWEQQISWDGESVPFIFEATENGLRKTFDSAKLRCPHAKIGRAPDQPRFRGVR